MSDTTGPPLNLLLLKEGTMTPKYYFDYNMAILNELAADIIARGLSDNLVAAWKLGEASGTRSDSSGSNHLTDNNTVTQATGKIGNAAQFTSTNSEYLSIADNTALSTGDIDFTIVGWVYLDFKGAERAFVSKSNFATLGEYGLLYSDIPDRFRFLIQNGATFVAVNADALGSPALATWYFIVAWHDSIANTINIQVNNGTVNSQSTGATVPADSATEFRLGADAAGGSFMNGRLDAFHFWKRVLTESERAVLYNAGVGREHPF